MKQSVIFLIALTLGKTDICHYGCEMTLVSTGQKVWVGPRDEVVISYRVIKVNRSVNDRRGGY